MSKQRTRLTLKQRIDGPIQLLFAFGEQGKLLACVPIWKWATKEKLPLPQPASIPDSHDAITKGVKAIVPIIERDKQDKLDRAKVKAEFREMTQGRTSCRSSQLI